MQGRAEGSFKKKVISRDSESGKRILSGIDRAGLRSPEAATGVDNEERQQRRMEEYLEEPSNCLPAPRKSRAGMAMDFIAEDFELLA